MQRFRASGFAAAPTLVARGSHRRPDELDQLRGHFAMLCTVIEQQLQKLHNADRQLREAIAALSHDLQTPLTALGGYLETVRMHGESLSAAERTHYLDLAALQHQRLSNMVREQFELSLLDSAAVRFGPQPASLSDLVHDVVQELRPGAETAGIMLLAEVPADAALVRMDVALVQRVLENLLSNAIRHTPRGGRITVSVSRADGSAVVAVSDTGDGIPPADLARVFDRSFRGSSPEDRSGAGLGLAIAKRIVELHEGHIAVDSASGAGARFVFNLSLAEGARTEPGAGKG
jgi:two-component system, OmpR family, sensor kinase